MRARGLWKWEVWGILGSCFNSLGRWHREAPGQTVKLLVGRKRADCSARMVAQDFISIFFFAVASQSEMAAWKWIDGRSDRLTEFVVQEK